MRFLIFSEYGIIFTDNYLPEEIESGAFYRNVRSDFLSLMKENGRKFIIVEVCDEDANLLGRMKIVA